MAYSVADRGSAEPIGGIPVFGLYPTIRILLKLNTTALLTMPRRARLEHNQPRVLTRFMRSGLLALTAPICRRAAGFRAEALMRAGAQGLTVSTLVNNIFPKHRAAAATGQSRGRRFSGRFSPEGH